METCIVLISIDYVNARKVCNHIENTKFNSRDEVRETIKNQLGEGDSHVAIYRLTDFMEEVNDQGLDDLSNYFISYIHINLDI
jgi:hypothetical protein